MSEYYEPVRNCLEAARNQRFCAGAEEAAVTIKELQSRLDEMQKVIEAYQYPPSLAVIAERDAALLRLDRITKLVDDYNEIDEEADDNPWKVIGAIDEELTTTPVVERHGMIAALAYTRESDKSLELPEGFTEVASSKVERQESKS